MKDTQDILRKLVSSSPVFTEARFHKRRTHSVSVQKGLVKQTKASLTVGVGFRVLVDGAWGFSSTSDFSEYSLAKTLKSAIECATSLSQLKKSKLSSLPSTSLARGEFILDGYKELEGMSLKDKLGIVLQAEEATRKHSGTIQTASCGYNEIFEDKHIITSDGADALSLLARSEIKFSAVASHNGEMAEGYASSGKTGAWSCLFQEKSIESMTNQTAELAVDLLRAPKMPGGVSTLILSPAIVGLLSHEAIGHTVEADFVLSGSVAKDKIGQKVASPLVTLCDGGIVPHYANGGGDLLVDDEGVPTQTTLIIKDGLLNSYLHNRESAAIFGVAPTGNARAWLYSDEPLIRMRNTYVAPGNDTLENMISTTEDGYLVEGALGGQADSTGEFMFGAQKVTRIEKGKKKNLFRGATLSGQAFDVLSTVDAVSKEFHLDLGSGYCGKGQPAKVDAGGPYIRCKAKIGGVQE